MPITSHTHESSTQADGSTQNILRMYDQDAREYMIGWHAPVGFDNAAKISLSIAEMDEQLKITEFDSIIGRANPD